MHLGRCISYITELQTNAQMNVCSVWIPLSELLQSNMRSPLWDMRLSWRWGWWCYSSGLWRRVDSSVDTNVSEKHTVFIFRASPLKPWRWREYTSLKRWHPPMSLHRVKTQKSIASSICSSINFLTVTSLPFLHVSDVGWPPVPPFAGQSRKLTSNPASHILHEMSRKFPFS
jgi:hypothetical protein